MQWSLILADVCAAMGAARPLCANLPFFEGGKSFGDHMTMQASRSSPRGRRYRLSFFLLRHAASNPPAESAAHMPAVDLAHAPSARRPERAGKARVFRSDGQRPKSFGVVH